MYWWLQPYPYTFRANYIVDANGDGYADGVLQETIQGGGMSYLFFQGTSMVRRFFVPCCTPLSQRLALIDILAHML